jgi:hypothetical protein
LLTWKEATEKQERGEDVAFFRDRQEDKNILKDFFADYMQENSLEFDKIKRVTSNGDIKYKVDGETKTLSFEALISWLSAKEATNQNTVTSEKIASILAPLKEQDVNILAGAMKGDMSSLSLGELNAA